MFSENIPEEIILYIWGFVETNNDIISLVKTSKKHWKIAKTHGCIKNIEFGWNSDYMNFVSLYNTPNIFLRQLTIRQLSNPTEWIPSNKWPKIMIFDRCFMRGKYIDPKISETEILIINEYYTSTSNIPMQNKNLKINWGKLPKLRVLDIRTLDMDFTGLEECNNLEAIRIDLSIDITRTFPKNIANLKKLRFFAFSGCISREPLHFVSPVLKFCYFAKEYPCTAVSKMIPQHSMNSASWVNIRFYNPLEYIEDGI